MSKRIAKKIFSRKDVLEAAKIWDNAPGLRGFKVGTRYEVRIKDKAYPPKAIASIANELSTGEVLFLLQKALREKRSSCTPSVSEIQRSYGLQRT
jgi:predicted molibdopterin-dependent oxidoreductase YjgC